MENYVVYMHYLPKVSEDGKESLSINAHGTPKKFIELSEAKKFAADNKNKFDRVIVIKEEYGKQSKVDRYIDGQNEVLI